MGNPSSSLNATIRRADAPDGGARVAAPTASCSPLTGATTEELSHAAQHHHSAEWRRQRRDEIAVIAPPKRAAHDRRRKAAESVGEQPSRIGAEVCLVNLLHPGGRIYPTCPSHCMRGTTPHHCSAVIDCSGTRSRRRAYGRTGYKGRSSDPSRSTPTRTRMETASAIFAVSSPNSTTSLV